MLEVVTGKNGVVLLDVYLNLILQAVGLKHAVDRRYIEIVLMFGRLLRFGLDQDSTLETDLVFMFNNVVEEPAELVEFASKISVEQSLIPFASAPEHIVLAAKLMGDLQRILHLRGGVGEYLRIRVGRSAPHEAAIGEKVRSAPQEANFCLFDLPRKDVRDGADIAV